MSVRKMTVALLGALMSVGLLAGCGSEANEPEPVDWGSSGSEKKPTEKSPDKDEGTDASPFPDKNVSDAAQAWLDASNKAMQTLDPEPMVALSDPACENCANFAGYLRDLKKNGGQLKGDFAEVTRGSKAPEVDGKTATVTLTVERGPWSEISKAGASPREFESDSYDIEFDLKLENGSWIVTEMLPLVED